MVWMWVRFPTPEQRFFRYTCKLDICAMEFHSALKIDLPAFDTGYIQNEQATSENADIPATEDPVWILGRKYSALYDLDDIRMDIRSKIWFSYRKGFPAIGGTGPTFDNGWGCMLRCGQMVMAQALICRHLGRGWLWNPSGPDPVYLHILKMFQDRKDCPYSIHQIAQMGVSEGKEIGHWFGPNTVAQVLRKLAAYDDWSSVVVHVALDNAVIIDDIKTLCKSSNTVCRAHAGLQQTMSLTSTCVNKNDTVADTHEGCFSCSQNKWKELAKTKWKPLLLFIPLRLGLCTFNPVYAKGLKTSFMLKQTLGVIGGKPNHALYFIGIVGNEVIFLDPHTTQSSVDLDNESSDDRSFHIQYGASERMPISEIDPSIALCFFFESEEDVDSWCYQVQKLIAKEKQPLFEIAKERPSHWPPLEMEPVYTDANTSHEFTLLDDERKFDTSDEEFEIL